jgi:hypothetical protein
MAGTFADQATLANDNAFIAKVKCAMIFRATELSNSATAQTYQTLAQCREILLSAGSTADTIAALVATGNATIASAAPTVPSDGDTQYAVNTVLTALLK